MKKALLPILLAVLAVAGCSKDDETSSKYDYCNFVNFKYYNGTKDTLGELANDYILLGIDSAYSDAQIKNFISTLSEVDPTYQYTAHRSPRYRFKEIPLRLSALKTCPEITQIISSLEQAQIVAYVHYTMKTDYCLNAYGGPMGNRCIVSYGSDFSVKVWDENDLSALNSMMAETHTELVERDYPLKGWFQLRATKESAGDALKMANYFYESGLFRYSEPGISQYPVE